MSSKKNPIIIFTGPSGVGKGTLERLIFEFDELNLEISCSVTTRKKRHGEIDGVHYYFMDKQTVENKIDNNEFIEYSYHFENYYGTLFSELDRIHKKNSVPFLEIETTGAKQIIEKYGTKKDYNIITIFLLPPSISELKARIIKRGSEDDDTLRLRLAKAKEEMDDSNKFKYKVVNDVPERAAEEIRQILHKELGI